MQDQFDSQCGSECNDSVVGDAGSRCMEGKGVGCSSVESNIDIGNLRDGQPQENDEICDRTSEFGNPYHASESVTRSDDCDAHEMYFNQVLHRSPPHISCRVAAEVVAKLRGLPPPKASWKAPLVPQVVQAFGSLCGRVESGQRVTLWCWYPPDRCHCESIRDQVLVWCQKGFRRAGEASSELIETPALSQPASRGAVPEEYQISYTPAEDSLRRAVYDLSLDWLFEEPQNPTGPPLEVRQVELDASTIDPGADVYRQLHLTWEFQALKESSQYLRDFVRAFVASTPGRAR